ncbi:NAD(P)H-hydrate epimerase [Alphaproteobacteria bacterium GH1-50]|uniref:NAD(P)H-hydrate epimerase n=1 Tax=Kangsaoukella pontilimi TaxID=2691042 RepID=A0A7C9M9L7_9RHOB|nr:NAD(P)H-hydrate epimerase [Kangsaoukella pontilimi]
MTELLTAAQMRAIEEEAIASGRVTGLELMERAGRGVVEAMLSQWPELRDGPQYAVILCGPGNNGGDGFVVARLLTELGWRVSVLALGDPAKLPPDAKSNHARWAIDHAVVSYSVDEILKAEVSARDSGAESLVIVDALFGIGQRAPMDDIVAPFRAFINASAERGALPAPVVVAVDLPTGYDADSGAALAAIPFHADLIVTFHARKPLHDMPHFGDVPLRVVDIGL